jgi:UDP:flavonoid glycosyltransferase YjiC (YdhE family)
VRSVANSPLRLQFPESTWEGVKTSRNTSNPDDDRILSFLDRMEAKHGPRSVAYVSFGSAWFPATRPELVEYLLASLIENKVPFVFAHASELFNPPRSLLDLIEPYEDGESVKFAPQWQVLEHPATQFFLSHCGSNSTAEAILSGVPLVAMPFGADQGEFASMREYTVPPPLSHDVWSLTRDCS